MSQCFKCGVKRINSKVELRLRVGHSGWASHFAQPVSRRPVWESYSVTLLANWQTLTNQPMCEQSAKPAERERLIRWHLSSRWKRRARLDHWCEMWAKSRSNVSSIEMAPGKDRERGSKRAKCKHYLSSTENSANNRKYGLREQTCCWWQDAN